MLDQKKRCAWVSDTFPEYVRYHDDEWGVPVYDKKKLFEFLTLEGAQAGLSWSTILKKRIGYTNAFAQWDVEQVARFPEKQIQKLMDDPGIVRNQLKIRSTVTNARAILNLRDSGVNFSQYLWQFVDGKPVINKYKKLGDVPAKTGLSDSLSKDLKRQGFKFVGSTIMYAFMQAVGMVNDHTTDCFRHDQV